MVSVLPKSNLGCAGSQSPCHSSPVTGGRSGPLHPSERDPSRFPCVTLPFRRLAPENGCTMSRLAQVSRELRHVRRPVRIEAYLHCRGRRHDVTIVDCSRGGLRLESAMRMAAGDRVTVELLSGDRLPVIVAWASGRHIGTQFIGPISPGNPAMTTLDLAAERYGRLELAERVSKF